MTAYHTNYPDIDAPGTNAAASTTFNFVAKDPCAEVTGTTIALDTAAIVAAWPTVQSIYSSTDYAVDTTNWVTVTDLTGRNPPVDCGALDVSFTLATDGSQYLTELDSTATVDFASDTSALGDWTLTVAVHHANYIGGSNPVATYDH